MQIVADGRRCLRCSDGVPVEAKLSEDPAAPASLVRTLAYALPAKPFLPPPPRHTDVGKRSFDSRPPRPGTPPAGVPFAASASPFAAVQLAGGAAGGASGEITPVLSSSPRAHAHPGQPLHPSIHPNQDPAWPAAAADQPGGLVLPRSSSLADSAHSLDQYEPAARGGGPGARYSGEVWLLQELCAGGTLQDAVERGRFHSPDGALDMPAVLATAQVRRIRRLLLGISKRSQKGL